MNPRTPILVTPAIIALLLLTGCATSPTETLTAPRTLVAPYESTKGEVLWAIVPLRNETGTTIVKPDAVSDKLVAAVEEVRGVRAVPLNRTIEAMRALDLPALHTPDQARALAVAMGVDGVLVGSITAYDPYTPAFGISLALYAPPGGSGFQPSPLRPRELAARPTEGAPPPRSRRNEPPSGIVSEHFDAKNHQVQLDVKAFAQGRVRGQSALGWKRYLASMDLYTEFAAYRAVDELLKQEWTRSSAVAEAQENRP